MRLGKKRFEEMVEEATVDCYNDSELATGWFTMIESNLALPFETAVPGVTVTVDKVDLIVTDDSHSRHRTTSRTRRLYPAPDRSVGCAAGQNPGLEVARGRAPGPLPAPRP